MLSLVVLHSAEILLALIFILGGAVAVRQPGDRATRVSRFHIPFATTAVRLNGLLMVIAGLFLASGFLAHIAAWVLIVVLIPTTIVGHAFWQEQSPQRHIQLTHFLKNLGLLGGLLLIATMH